jgi:hypothetical protein
MVLGRVGINTFLKHLFTDFTGFIDITITPLNIYYFVLKALFA